MGMKRGMIPNTAVPATTLNKILKEYNINKIDFFSLDVEGYELEVLGGLDFNIYKPSYILIEVNTGEEDLYGFMEEHNYKNLGCLSDFNLIDDPQWPQTHNDYLFKAIK